MKKEWERDREKGEIYIYVLKKKQTGRKRDKRKEIEKKREKEKERERKKERQKERGIKK